MSLQTYDTNILQHTSSSSRVSRDDEETEYTMKQRLTKKRTHESQEDMNTEEQTVSYKKMQGSPPPAVGAVSALQYTAGSGVLDTCHLKMLIPSAAAGAIIGKGGETIAEVQQNMGAKVKLSKANDFYPGTNERVCLISGSKEAVTDVCNFVREKVKEKPDPHSKPAIDFDNKITAEREKQVKVIVPNSTAGMIIGKGGCTIQQIKEQSGSFVQLSQKPSDTTLPERVVTVIGEEESNKVALEMIIDKVQEDPQSGSCLNVSYSEVNGPIANANPTGSPYANGQQQQQAVAGMVEAGAAVSAAVPAVTSAAVNHLENTAHCSGSAGVNISVPGYSSVNLKLNFQSGQPPSDPRLVSQCLPHVNHSLRRSGYSEKVADEVTRAMGTLSIHGVLQLTPQMTGSAPAGDPGLSTNTGADPVFIPPPPQTQSPVNTTANQGPFGPAGLVPAPPSTSLNNQSLAGPGQINHFQPQPGTAAPPRASSPGPIISLNHQFPPLPVNNNSFGLATAANPLPPPPPPPGIEPEHGLAKVDIEVNESLVGAVLGPAGKSIIEIQQFSGANIQISKKGMYSPGTRNRVVSVTGSSKSVNTAKFLIELKVQDEESKRQSPYSVTPGGINM